MATIILAGVSSGTTSDAIAGKNDSSLIQASVILIDELNTTSSNANTEAIGGTRLRSAKGASSTQAIGGTRLRAIGGTRLRADNEADAQAIGGTRLRAIGGTRLRAIGGTRLRADNEADAQAIGGTRLRAIGGTRLRAIGGTRLRADNEADAQAIGGTRLRAIGGTRLRSACEASENAIGGTRLRGSKNVSSTQAIGGTRLRAIGGTHLRAIGGTRLRGIANELAEAGVDTFSVGPVKEVDPTTSRVTVMNRSIVIPTNGESDLPENGEMLAVLACQDSPEALMAYSYGEFFVPGSSEIVVSGVVSSTSPATATFQVEGYRIDYSALLANISKAPEIAVGSSVLIKGIMYPN